MDISKLTTNELQLLLKRVPKEVRKRRQKEKSKLLESITQIASKHGYSLSELIGKAARPSKAKKTKTGTRKPVAVKYRHPDQADLTWTGRGRMPRWVTKWLADGKSIKNLAV